MRIVSVRTRHLGACLGVISIFATLQCGFPFSGTGASSADSTGTQKSAVTGRAHALFDSSVTNFCSNGAILNSSGSGQWTCLGSLAQATFPLAVCTCDSYMGSYDMVVDGYNSTDGSKPGSQQASMGTNGRFASDSAVNINGSLTVNGSDGMRDSDVVNIGQDLIVPQGFASSDTLNVGHDAWFGVRAVAYAINVKGTLHLDKNATLSTQSKRPAFVRDTIPNAAPCACDDANVLDVAGYTAAQATDNDNGAINLDAADWENRPDDLEAELPCGRYYVEDISVNAPVTITATGRTALFVDGDAFVNHPWKITVADGAQLDVFVAGNLLSQGGFTFGNPNQPSAARLYVGGDIVAFDGDAKIYGSLYAPNAKVRVGRKASVYGGLFGKTLAHVDKLEVHYDTSLASAGSDGCSSAPVTTTPPAPPPTTPPPPPPTTPPPPPPPPPTTACTTCADCGQLTCGDGNCVPCSDNVPCCPGRTCQAGNCVQL